MPEAKNMRRYLLEALNITGLSLVCIPIHVYSADLPVLTFDFQMLTFETMGVDFC